MCSRSTYSCVTTQLCFYCSAMKAFLGLYFGLCLGLVLAATTERSLRFFDDPYYQSDFRENYAKLRLDKAPKEDATITDLSVCLRFR